MCDHDAGDFILDDRKGSDLDFQYLNMSIANIGFNDIPWDQFYSKIDSCCTQQPGLGHHKEKNFRSINIDWDGYFQEA